MVSHHNRWVGPAAMLAGLLYITQAVVGLVQPQQRSLRRVRIT